MFNKIVSAIKSDKPRRIAASSLLAIQKDRIFTKGKATDGSQIGTYSTNPISISESRQARNTGKTYFPAGYAEYKTAVGKNPGFVVLRNTDQMMGDFGVSVDGDSVTIGFQNKDNADKMGWMEEKYQRPIAENSDSEIDTFIEVLVREQNKMF